MAYLLDTNVFIEACTRYYGFGVCPGFWEWLDHSHSVGLLKSIKRVRDEILEREDELSKWCKIRKSMFVDTDDGKTYESFKSVFEKSLFLSQDV
jgi:hypothetical protein